MTPVEAFNLALLKIGESKGIVALTDQTRQAWTGALVYDTVLRGTLTAHPWSFATKYLALTLIRGPLDFTPADGSDPLVRAWDVAVTYPVGDVVTHNDVIYYSLQEAAGHEPPDADYWTETAPTEANPDWQYGYRWPSDCLFARRFTSPSGIQRRYDPRPIQWRKGRDINGLLLFTNEPVAVLEYTMIDCEHLWTDDLFLKAFQWHLASEIAPSLSRDEKMGPKCWAMFMDTLDLAKVVDARQQQQDGEGPASWIEARES